MKIRAFSLLEILVVIGIIAVLAGVLFPVFQSAKMAAKKTVSISNLRQCAQALTIYEGEWSAYPNYASAQDALAKAPTCDPNDYWRSACSSSYSTPRVGSYGYVAGIPDYQSTSDLQKAIYSDQPPPLLVSIYYGSNRVDPFDGMQPPNLTGCVRDKTCFMPTDLLRVQVDTSLKQRKYPTLRVSSGGWGGVVFSWPAVFLPEGVWQK